MRRDSFEAWAEAGGWDAPNERNIREFGKPLYRPDHNAKIKRSAEKRMEQIDKLPLKYRELVHEYGYPLIHQYIECGVKEPQRIRHLIDFTRGHYTDGRPAWVSNAKANGKCR